MTMKKLEEAIEIKEKIERCRQLLDIFSNPSLYQFVLATKTGSGLREIHIREDQLEHIRIYLLVDIEKRLEENEKIFSSM